MDRYKRAFGFNSLRLIVTMDAIKNQGCNGHISFGKWGAGDEFYRTGAGRNRDYRLPARLICDNDGYTRGVEGMLPNYAHKDQPWIVHRFVKGSKADAFNAKSKTAPECARVYDGRAAAAGGVPAPETR
ncbi:MAG: hypothetical protein Q8Q56_02105 [Alphaproteobacteria bacterium]|nr:hypothetical protein [Alphaproteobacteria bacterium]